MKFKVKDDNTTKGARDGMSKGKQIVIGLSLQCMHLDSLIDRNNSTCDRSLNMTGSNTCSTLVNDLMAPSLIARIRSNSGPFAAGM